MKDRARVHVIISGRVQGVFFRMETKQAADQLGVFGWVRNQQDGTVEAVFEADRDQVDAIVDWCRKGPPRADVADVTMIWEDYTGDFNRFEINFTR